jgi:hypothetical protein
MRYVHSHSVNSCIAAFVLCLFLFLVRGGYAAEDPRTYFCKFDSGVYAYLLSESSLELRPLYWFFSPGKLSGRYYSEPMTVREGQRFIVLKNEPEGFFGRWFLPGSANQVQIKLDPKPVWVKKYDVPLKLSADKNFKPKFSDCD